MKFRRLAALLLAFFLLAACNAGPSFLWQGPGGTALRLDPDGSLRLSPGEGRWVLTGRPAAGDGPLILDYEIRDGVLTLHYQGCGRSDFNHPPQR